MLNFTRYYDPRARQHKRTLSSPLTHKHSDCFNEIIVSILFLSTKKRFVWCTYPKISPTLHRITSKLTPTAFSQTAIKWAFWSLTLNDKMIIIQNNNKLTAPEIYFSVKTIEKTAECVFVLCYGMAGSVCRG